MKIMGWSFGLAVWWDVGYTVPLPGATAFVIGEKFDDKGAATKTLRVSAIVFFVQVYFDWKLESRPPVVEWRV